jgi:hypothetical protein
MKNLRTPFSAKVSSLTSQFIKATKLIIEVLGGFLVFYQIYQLLDSLF